MLAFQVFEELLALRLVNEKVSVGDPGHDFGVFENDVLALLLFVLLQLLDLDHSLVNISNDLVYFFSLGRNDFKFFVEGCGLFEVVENLGHKENCKQVLDVVTDENKQSNRGELQVDFGDVAFELWILHKVLENETVQGDL